MKSTASGWLYHLYISKVQNFRIKMTLCEKERFKHCWSGYKNLISLAVVQSVILFFPKYFEINTAHPHVMTIYCHAGLSHSHQKAENLVYLYISHLLPAPFSASNGLPVLLPSAEPPGSTPRAGSCVPPAHPIAQLWGCQSSQAPAATRKGLLLGQRWCARVGQHSEHWGGPAQLWGLEGDAEIIWKINFLAQFEVLESRHCLSARGAPKDQMCVVKLSNRVFIPSGSCTFIAKYFLAHTETRLLLEATSRVLKGHTEGRRCEKSGWGSGCTDPKSTTIAGRGCSQNTPVSRRAGEYNATHFYSKAQVTEPKPFLLGL